MNMYVYRWPTSFGFDFWLVSFVSAFEPNMGVVDNVYVDDLYVKSQQNLLDLQ